MKSRRGIGLMDGLMLIGITAMIVAGGAAFFADAMESARKAQAERQNTHPARVEASRVMPAQEPDTGHGQVRLYDDKSDGSYVATFE